MKFTFVLGIAFAVIYPFSGHTAEDANHPSPHRVCYVKIGDAPKRLCKQVFYILGLRPHSAAIGAKTSDGDVSFTAKENDSGTLVISSLYAGRVLKGSGICKLAISKGRVSKIDCRVHTELGIAIMKSTGDDPNDLDVRIGKKITRGEAEQSHEHAKSFQLSLPLLK